MTLKLVNSDSASYMTLQLVNGNSASYMTMELVNNYSAISYMTLQLVKMIKHIAFTEGYTHQDKTGTQNTRQTEKPKKHSGQRKSAGPGRWGVRCMGSSNLTAVLNNIPTYSWQGIAFTCPLQYWSFEDSCLMHCTDWLRNYVDPCLKTRTSMIRLWFAVKKLHWLKPSLLHCFHCKCNPV